MRYCARIWLCLVADYNMHENANQESAHSSRRAPDLIHLCVVPVGGARCECDSAPFSNVIWAIHPVIGLRAFLLQIVSFLARFANHRRDKCSLA